MKKILFILIFSIIGFNNISYSFFSKDIILNCEPKDEYFKDTYKKIKYFRFDSSGENSNIEFEWDAVEKKFMREKNTSLKVKEESFHIIDWDYYPETKDYRYREIYIIDRVKGTLIADMDQLTKKNYKFNKHRKTTYFQCKKIRKNRLPKKIIKKKF